ncbi:hypothetical protein B0A50_07863 [Salinomyces thailandicus]|uniref:Uncharacterized protein n=1 Tax=Salinomyces thailandicus TaxID=706561 RepID=A0A4U0TLF0_9PEZI|nr:hypothetical protein B0A50_07863 [Salinomyces thailandica]
MVQTRMQETFALAGIFPQLENLTFEVHSTSFTITRSMKTGRLGRVRFFTTAPSTGSALSRLLRFTPMLKIAFQPFSPNREVFSDLHERGSEFSLRSFFTHGNRFIYEASMREDKDTDEGLWYGVKIFPEPTPLVNLDEVYASHERLTAAD